MKQGTQEWFMARTGKVTASEVASVLYFLKQTKAEEAAKTKRESAERYNYKAQLVGERLTGAPDMSGFLSAEMQRGTDLEPLARAAYELQEDVEVEQVGFIDHPTIPMCGASPDGIIGTDGGLELKCPKTSTHLKWMLEGGVPEEHQAQMFMAMACTGRAWWDFGSYDDRLPGPLQFFCVRLMRDEARIAEIEQGIAQFNAEIDETIAKLKQICGKDFSLPQPKTVKREEAPESYLTEEDFAGLL